jgi:hypothetical protein
MSINAMTNSAAARRPDFGPVAAPPKGFAEVAAAAAGMPAAVPAGGIAVAANGNKTKNDVNTTLNVLFGYIPTEVLTLYVAILGVLHKPNSQSAFQPTTADWIAFFAFLGFTPIVVWLVYGAKLKAANKPLPISFGTWPVWEMFAATIAYLAWAFALPNSPFTEYSGTWYSAALSGIAVLVTSTILGLLAPFFQRPLSTK